MNARIALGTALLALLAPHTATAATLVDAGGVPAEPYQSWASASRMPAPAGRFTVRPDDFVCNERGRPASAFACTRPDGDVFLAPRCITTPDEDCQAYFWHELGHHFDWQMPEWKRRVFTRIIRTQLAWTQRTATVQPPSETFADSYALCAHNPDDVDYTFSDGSVYGQPHGLNQRRLRRVCKLIRQPN